LKGKGGRGAPRLKGPGEKKHIYVGRGKKGKATVKHVVVRVGFS